MGIAGQSRLRTRRAAWGNGEGLDGRLWIADADLRGRDRAAARKFVGDWCQALYQLFMEQWATVNQEEL